MDQYGVEIRFPRNSDPDPNLVIVSGKSEEAVYDCIDDLRNIEEEYLQVLFSDCLRYKRIIFLISVYLLLVRLGYCGTLSSSAKRVSI